MIVPKKTKQEQLLFEKYKGWLSSYFIPQTVIRNFKRDLSILKKSSLIILFSFAVNAQSGIVVAGNTQNNISYTIGSQLVELQIPIVEEVTLGVPKFEVPEQPKPKPIIKKKPKSFFEKLIEFFKNLINKNK